MILAAKIQSDRKKALLLLLAGIILLAAAAFMRFIGTDTPENRVRHAETVLTQLDQQVRNDLEHLISLQDDESIHDFFALARNERSGISYYILENQKLVRWSDNEPVLADTTAEHLPDSGVLQLPNGIFLSESVEKGDRKVIGLVLIKHEYAYENRYLKNEFNSLLGLSPWLVPVQKSDLSLNMPGGSHLFYLESAEAEGCTSFGPAAWLYIAGIILLLIACMLRMKSMIHSHPLRTLWLSLLIIGIRILMIILKFPQELYDSDLFSPQNYASSFLFNSLGDLMLNAILMACLSGLMYFKSNDAVRQRGSSVIIWVYGAMLFAAGFFIHHLFEGLVMNSRISFDMSRLSDLSVYTLLGFSCMALILLSYFLLLIAFSRFLTRKKVKFGGVILIIVASSVYTAFLVHEQNTMKEKESRMLFAQKVDARQDHVAEYLFKDIEKSITQDTLIHQWIEERNNSLAKIQQRLSSQYFTGYLAKFECSVFVFDSLGHSIQADKAQDSLSYYLNLAHNQGKPTYSEHLFYLKNESGRLSYLAILPLSQGGMDKSFHLVIWMTARFFQSDEGFPELFIGGKATEKNETGEYSVAKYKGGELVYEFGNYIYSFSSDELEKQNPGNDFVSLGGYSHLLYHTADGTLIVVSRPLQGPFMLLTLFSWIFAFYFIFYALVYLVFHRTGSAEPVSMNLTRRIQVSVIMLVVLSFIFIGTGTVIYILKKYETDQQRSISGQVNGLWFLLGNNLGFQSALSGTSREVRVNELNELVRNLNIDFNLFDEQGNLFYSSQPKIFEQKIISARMNSQALYEIRKKGKTQYIHPENTGRLKYIAAYSPFTDRNGNITGYLNLPYFEKQNELNREISGFLSALINIYVFLFAIAVLVTLFISSRITKPLLLIQEKLGAFRLGKRNEPIEYHRNDEIGQLVKEYNRMLDELSLSAEKLARSERESAWREMAKQVAHEIKNPLTPMKLSVQHLQRAWAENRSDKEELLNKMSKTIIHQIDTLSDIATEFSNFAKMPEAKMQRLNIASVLESSVALFRETPGISIKLTKPDVDIFVNADPDQLMRAFSNLLKNAVQAIPAGRNGLIELNLSEGPVDYCTISFRDNGVGIAENQKDKIFSPNFTTKSSGMGLGLSLVKSIVQVSGGTIWFSSTYNEGSSFFIRLPRIS